MPRLFTLMLAVFLILATDACTTFRYYAQSVSGQMSLLSKRQSINQVIATPGIQDATREQLERINDIREFASQHLHLPENNSYRSYADIGRDYVVWNVFAVPEFSLQPEVWCYLFVGCLSYRGYFSEENAQRYARELEQQGLDVFVGGVAAYSTLGWFDDPVLNTMLKWDRVRLAKVMFHELAHQLIYIKDDTGFNEAFADTVAQVGVRRWLIATVQYELQMKFDQEMQRENQFVDLVSRYKEKLVALYNNKVLSENTKRMQKNSLFTQMKEDYFRIRSTWDTDEGYDKWFEAGLNNARLAAVITYRQYVPGFLALLNSSNNELSTFYDVVSTLGKCELSLRHRVLSARLPKFDC